MTRQITNDQYLTLALRYNEQRTINDSLRKEVTELKQTNELLRNYFKDNMLEIDQLKDRLDEFIVDEEDKYNAGMVWVRGNLDNDTGETK